MDENCAEAPTGAEAEAERSSPAKTDVEFNNEVGKLSPDRADSPDSNCAICLGKLQNKSFTDGCLHQFCFTCLLKWSKVKSECPLCKQGFESIIHNVRSIEDYDQYHLRQNEPRISIPDLQFPIIDGPLLPRFRYRTTVASRPGQSYFEYFHQLERMISHGEIIPPGYLIPRHAQRTCSYHTRRGSSVPGRLATRRSHRRVRDNDSSAPGTSAFRRHIYNSHLWVRRVPDLTGRFRECSPEFFLNNPAQTHRLYPWLNRELNVLLSSTEHGVREVIEIIMNLLPRCNILSSEFRAALRPFVGTNTEHFLHEFYAFGTSPFDMVGYDNVCIYGPELTFHDGDTSDSDVQIVDEIVRSDASYRPSDDLPTYDLSHNENGSPVAGPSRGTDVHLVNTSSDSDSDCEIVGVVKARHLRTPEIITLDSDSNPEPADADGVRQNETDISEVSEPESKPKINGEHVNNEENVNAEDSDEQKPNIDHGPRQSAEHVRHRRQYSTLLDLENKNRNSSEPSSSRRRRSVSNDSVLDARHYRHSYSKRSVAKSRYFISSSSSSSSESSSDEEWGTKKYLRKHKKDKHKRSGISEKRSKEKDSKKRRLKKDKKSKPIKHWKKKLCKKHETSSSDENFEPAAQSNGREHILLGSPSSHSERSCSNNDYVNPYLCGVRKKRSRLRSVVHVKCNFDDNSSSQSATGSGNYYSSSGLMKSNERESSVPWTGASASSNSVSNYSVVAGTSSASASASTCNHTNTSVPHHRLRALSTSSSSSSASTVYSRKSYRKVKSSRKHV